MDKEAVLQATDSVLERMGIGKTGDRLALKRFCQELTDEKSTSRKQFLLETFLKRKSSKKSKKSVSIPTPEASAIKPRTRKIQVGWLHHDSAQGKYISVRLAKGGGSRTVEMPITATKNEIVPTAIELFFKNGTSQFGPSIDFNFGLANFKNEDISDTLMINEREVPFTIQNYLEAYKTNKVRLYLTSYPKVEVLDIESDGEDIRPQLRCPKKRDAETSVVEEEAAVDMFASLGREVHVKESLESRRAMIKQQDKEYEESLECDKAKQMKLENEIEDCLRKEALRQSRAGRVPPEPVGGEDNFVAVQIRHPIYGLLKRLFASTDLLASVYDWVGSYSTDPEHFVLCDTYGMQMAPSQPVSSADKCTLNMIESLWTPAFNDDTEVEFKGFGDMTNHSFDTIPSFDMDLEQLQSGPETPDQLFPLEEPQYNPELLDQPLDSEQPQYGPEPPDNLVDNNKDPWLVNSIKI